MGNERERFSLCLSALPKNEEQNSFVAIPSFVCLFICLSHSPHSLVRSIVFSHFLFLLFLYACSFVLQRLNDESLIQYSKHLVFHGFSPSHKFFCGFSGTTATSTTKLWSICTCCVLCHLKTLLQKKVLSSRLLGGHCRNC